MRKGIGVSPGVVVGVAHRVESVFGEFEQQTLESPALVGSEVERFERALAEASAWYEAYISAVGEQVGDTYAEIFRTHLQILNDPSLRSKVRSLIENQRLTALSALQAVMNSYAAQFAQIKQENFRERINDIRDVILRIESHLRMRNAAAADFAGGSRNGSGNGNGNGDESVILVAQRSCRARRSGFPTCRSRGS